MSEKGEIIYREEETFTDKYESDRLRTEIPGFDKILGGGIPRGATTLVAGGCGSGKSIFCLQTLYNGALKHDEPGAYISFEEPAESIRNTARKFGWDVDALEKKNVLKIMLKDPYEIKDFSKTLSGEMYYTFKDMGVKRIVIDSVTYLASTVGNNYEIRKTVATLARRLREIGASTFLVSEIPEGATGVGRYGMEEFVTDGVVKFHNIHLKENRQRAVEILKMRRTKHSILLHPFCINNKGITVFAEQPIFK